MSQPTSASPLEPSSTSSPGDHPAVGLVRVLGGYGAAIGLAVAGVVTGSSALVAVVTIATAGAVAKLAEHVSLPKLRRK